jgi:hypothetical protein
MLNHVAHGNNLMGENHHQNQHVLDLVGCIHELKEHNQKGNKLLERALELTIANESNVIDELQENPQRLELAIQELSRAHQIALDCESITKSLCLRIQKLQQVVQNPQESITEVERKPKRKDLNHLGRQKLIVSMINLRAPSCIF